MADYKYIGLTAYIKENEANEDKFTVLGRALDSLQGSFDLERDINMHYQNIVNSEAYQYLYEHDYVTFPKEYELPNGTPAKYDRAVIEPSEIKGSKLYRIYVPAVAKDQDKIQHFIYNALRPVLLALFNEDLVHMATKEAMEYEDFKDGKETLLVSAKDRNRVSV
jgi:hypothetical protein